MRCPLCTNESHFYFEDKKRPYQQCGKCDLVFVPDEFILSPEKEKAEYDLHDNEIHDSGYRNFLSRIYNPITDKVKSPATGLDFGCGPGPALYHMFKETGYEMSLYDLFYYPDRSVLSSSYDFITCTEVIEHIKNPIEIWDQLLNCLKKGGVLGIMTKLVTSREAFKNWHYKNDPTHIRFYSENTLEWVAKKYQKDIEFIGKDVILFT